MHAKRKYLKPLKVPKPIQWVVEWLGGRVVELTISFALGIGTAIWAFFKDLPGPFFVPIGLSTSIAAMILLVAYTKVKRFVYRVVPEEDYKLLEAERDRLQRALNEKRPYLSPPATTSDFFPEKRLFRWSAAFTNNGDAPAFGLHIRFGVSLSGLPNDFGVISPGNGPDRLCPGDPAFAFFMMLTGDFYVGQRMVLYAKISYSDSSETGEPDFQDDYFFAHTIGDLSYGRPTFLTLSTSEEEAFRHKLRAATVQPETNPPSSIIVVSPERPSQA